LHLNPAYWQQNAAGKTRGLSMIRILLTLVLAGCATNVALDHPPRPEWVGEDVKAITEGMQRSAAPTKTELVAPLRPYQVP
jgi:hypothetical protein